VLVSIPDAERLADVVSERSTGKDSSMHGDSHWQRVTKTGLTLLPQVPHANPHLVFLFARFNDSMRFNDNQDPLHGLKGQRWRGSCVTRRSTSDRLARSAKEQRRSREIGRCTDG
jgi:hypothetical protein